MMQDDKGHADNRGRAVGAEGPEPRAILIPGPGPVEPSCVRCGAPATAPDTDLYCRRCDGALAAMEAAGDVDPPTSLIRPPGGDAADEPVFVFRANGHDMVLLSDVRRLFRNGRGSVVADLELEIEALEIAAVECAAGVVTAEWTPDAPHVDALLNLEAARTGLEQATALRRVHSNLLRALAMIGLVLVVLVGGCVASTDRTVTRDEACELYDAETEGAPCEVSCPHRTATGGACDVERVHECATAVRSFDEACADVVIATAAACDEACGVPQ